LFHNNNNNNNNIVTNNSIVFSLFWHLIENNINKDISLVKHNGLIYFDRDYYHLSK